MTWQEIKPETAGAWLKLVEKYGGFGIMLAALLWFGFSMLRNFEAVTHQQTLHMESMSELMQERNATQREQFMILDKISDAMAADNATMRDLQANQFKIIAALDRIADKVEDRRPEKAEGP